MRTGETVTDLGLYATECCSEELIFDMGDQFAKCPRCQKLCIWGGRRRDRQHRRV